MEVNFEDLHAYCTNNPLTLLVRGLINGYVVTFDPQWQQHPAGEQILSDGRPIPTPFPVYSGVLFTRRIDEEGQNRSPLQVGRIESLISMPTSIYRPGTPEDPDNQYPEFSGKVLDYSYYGTYADLVAQHKVEIDEDLVINLQGKVVTAGLIDPHAHLEAWGTLVEDVYHRVNFTSGNTESLLNELTRWANIHDSDRPYWPWVVGHGYDGTLESGSVPLGKSLNRVSRTNSDLFYQGICKCSGRSGAAHMPESEDPAQIWPVFVYNSSGQIAWFNDVALSFFNDFEYNGGNGQHANENLVDGQPTPPGRGRVVFQTGEATRTSDESSWRVSCEESNAFDDLTPPFHVDVRAGGTTTKPVWNIDVGPGAIRPSSTVWTVLAIETDPTTGHRILTIQNRLIPFPVPVNGIDNAIWYIPKPIPRVLEKDLPGGDTRNYYNTPSTSVVGYDAATDNLEYSIIHYPLMRKFDKFFTYFWHPLHGSSHANIFYYDRMGDGAGLGQMQQEVRNQCLASAVSNYHSYGITSAHDCILYRGGPGFDSYLNLSRITFSNSEGPYPDLRMRMRLYYYVESYEGMLAIKNTYITPANLAEGDAAKLESGWTKAMGWKIAIDGGTLAGTIATQVPMPDVFPSQAEVYYDPFNPPYGTNDPPTEAYQLVDPNATYARQRTFGLLIHSPKAKEFYDGRLFDPDPSNVAQRAFMAEMEKGLFDLNYNNPELSDIYNAITRNLGSWVSGSREALARMIRQARVWGLDTNPENHGNIKHQISFHACGDLAVAVTIKAIIDSKDGNYKYFSPNDSTGGGNWISRADSALEIWMLGALSGDGDPRFRIEHGNWISKYTIFDMQSLNLDSIANGYSVLVSVQPQLVIGGGVFFKRAFPYDSDPWPIPGRWNLVTGRMADSWSVNHSFWRSRALYLMPLRELIKNQIPVCLGADPPADPLPYPTLAFQGATNRGYCVGTTLESVLDPKLKFDEQSRTADGALFKEYRIERCHPLSQWIAMGDVLASHTYWSAAASYDEGELGLIRPGYHGDLAIWNWNMLDVLNPDLLQLQLGESAVTCQPLPSDGPIYPENLLPEGFVFPNPSSRLPLENQATLVGGMIVFVRHPTRDLLNYFHLGSYKNA